MATQTEPSETNGLRRFYLHYPAGNHAYVVVVDSQRRPFDFSDNTFKPASELATLRDACLYATGRHEERADHAYSYSVEFDLARLLAGSNPETVPAEGSVISVHWLVQAGEEPDVKVARQCESCRLRVASGAFDPIDTSSRDLLDENIAFEKRAKFDKEYREFVLREIESQEHRRQHLAAAVRIGDVAKTLRIVAEDLCYWAGNLKQHLLHQVSHLAKDPSFVRMRDVPEDAPFRVYETWILREWIGSHEAFDLLEFHKGPEYARSFSARLDRLHEARAEFAKLLVQYTVETRGEDVQGIFALDEIRKDLKHKAIWLAEHLDRVAMQFDAAKSLSQNQGTVTSTSPPHAFASHGGDPKFPYALGMAYSSLSSALDEAIDLYKHTLRFPNPMSVIDAIERFVHELQLVPTWFSELERRVSLVETVCDGSYAVVRQNALASYTDTPAQLCRAKLAIEMLRGNSEGPRFLAEIIDVRKNVEAILVEPSLGLSPAARQAFGDWGDMCQRVQQEAERLEVDGCWHLYHVYRAAEPNASDRSQAAKAILQTEMGGANLEKVRAAVQSLTAWIREADARKLEQVTKADLPSRLGSESAFTTRTLLDLSNTKMLLLRTVFELGAMSSDKKVTGSDIARCSKMPADQRLRSELAALRDLKLLGGQKGERGYWLTATALDYVGKSNDE